MKAIIVLRPSLNLPVKARRHHLWPFFLQRQVWKILMVGSFFGKWEVGWLVVCYTIRIFRSTQPLVDLIFFQMDFFGNLKSCLIFKTTMLSEFFKVRKFLKEINMCSKKRKENIRFLRTRQFPLKFSDLYVFNMIPQNSDIPVKYAKCWNQRIQRIYLIFLKIQSTNWSNCLVININHEF